MEITEEQKKLAAKYESEQKAKQQAMNEMMKMKEQATVEAEAVARFILKIDDIKFRRTQLLIENQSKGNTSVNSEYVLGKSICALE